MSRPGPLKPPHVAASVSPSFACVLQFSARGAAWVRLTGELDLGCADQVTDRLDDAFARARLVVLDLRGLTFMDSAGIGVLARAQVRAQTQERRLVIIRGPRQIDRLLEMAGLGERLEITDLLPVSLSPGDAGPPASPPSRDPIDPARAGLDRPGPAEGAA